MIPIFEQGEGKGIGHSFDTFLRRFLDICEEHLKTDRATAFAFILYDFSNEATKQVLRNQGGFTRLDRLSGNDLSVFFLHSENRRQFRAFNNIFLQAFEIPENKKLPYVLFFKVKDGEVKDIEIVELEQSHIMFAFEELYKVIENYIGKNKNDNLKKTPSKFVRILKSAKRISGEKLLEHIITKIGEYAGQNLL